MKTEIHNGNEIIDVNFEQRKVVIHERYEKLRILSDLLLGIWFLSGSIMFFYKHWTYWGTWLFVIGSVQMLIGPSIKIIHKLHMKKF
ncbi:YrhK family protein [Alicyclobacillus fodiniaquatilis]|uniref:YrhK family protein n=1 Tax=Alicyclobacillus fodiniaquatilis TaxID=1661150 RepID=A0ABW4JQ71_9BACL